MGKSDNGTDWYTAPVGSAITQFRRFILLSRLLNHPGLSEKSKVLYKYLDAKIEKDAFDSDAFETYFAKTRFE